MSIIVVNNLTKKFKEPNKTDLIAVNDVSFNVSEGEIFGLLGPNGAGKTTTLEIIEGIQKPSSGETLIKNI
ncbi:ATP-binding cassette domain-containing protein, partial [Patescibacteria group bacterium]|nr:ATP-binding cassette domain-containing protein [Patescibacteria group bacterium]